MLGYGVRYLGLGPYEGVVKGYRKKKKSKKQPKANWFERLTVDEIKQLCRAAKLPVSGSKGDVVSRLLDSDATSHFGSERRAASFSWKTGTFNMGKDGVSVDDLKRELRNLSLPVTGSKHALVLRLLQHTHGTGGETGAPKRAAAASSNANIDAYDAEGNPVPPMAKKASKPKPPARPNLEKLRERIVKKIYPASKSSWSDYKYKEHCSDVCMLAYKMMDAEAQKGFAATRDPILFEAFIAVVEPIVEAWDDFTGQGRCSYALKLVLGEAEEALKKSEDTEDAFAESGRKFRQLCVDLEKKYEDYVGGPLHSSLF